MYVNIDYNEFHFANHYKNLICYEFIENLGEWKVSQNIEGVPFKDGDSIIDFMTTLQNLEKTLVKRFRDGWEVQAPYVDGFGHPDNPYLHNREVKFDSFVLKRAVSGKFFVWGIRKPYNDEFNVLNKHRQNIINKKCLLAKQEYEKLHKLVRIV